MANIPGVGLPGCSALIDDEPTKPMPNPTPDMLNGDPIFDAIWEVIKHWDINVPGYYHGYCGANGSHVTMIYQALMQAHLKGKE